MLYFKRVIHLAKSSHSAKRPSTNIGLTLSNVFFFFTKKVSLNCLLGKLTAPVMFACYHFVWIWGSNILVM